MQKFSAGLEREKLYFLVIEEQAIGDMKDLSQCLKVAHDDGYNILPLIVPNDCTHRIKIIEPEKEKRSLLTWVKEEVWEKLI